MINKTKSQKIIVLYLTLMLGFVIFLSVMLFTSIKPRDIPSLYTSDTTKAQRGSIISADGFNVATTKKLYKAVVNKKNIDPKKYDLFVELFSIYSNIDSKKVRKRLNARKSIVTLSYSISAKQAQALKSLAFELLRMGVFVEYTSSSGVKIFHGLNILESGEKREYPYAKLLTPLIGYPHKLEEDGYTRIHGVKGIEKSYEKDLISHQNGYERAKRDVNNYMILNKEGYKKETIDGYDIKLFTPLTLQVRIEKVLDRYKKDLDANEIMIVVMNSQNGAILSLSSSNRFLPTDIKKSEYPYLNTDPIEYEFEIGSVMKPIIFSLLLDKKLINPYDLVDGHNGRFKIGKKIITDEHKFDWLSAENVIVYSSNVGISQLAQKLNPLDYHEGLKKFGFSKKSNIDVPYEKAGSIPSIKKLNNEIYKATAAYGYGISATLIQLVKAYNAFNNSGRLVTPRVVDKLIDKFNKPIPLEEYESVQVINQSTASRMKNILIKTVNHGTGYKTRVEGLEIGGKTGTAHIAENGTYVNKYNTSFLGFANDGASKYTIGVSVMEPKTNYFAASTAVPVFKEIVDILVEEGYLDINPKFKLPLRKRVH